MRALFALGCTREAEAFVNWLLHATRLTQPELRILYDVHGNAPGEERILEGFAGTRDPCRYGSATPLTGSDSSMCTAR